MRITYRSENTRDYWKRRWSNTELDTFETNHDIYPIKFSELTIKDSNGKILEAGCGAGRVVMYYHNKGYDITGFDYIEDVIESIKEKYPELKVDYGDIYNLKYIDASFDYLLAFGLFHGLESNLDRALQESRRVLKTGGKICLSFRANNIQNFLSDYLYRIKSGNLILKKRIFHKSNISKAELHNLLTANGFKVINIMKAENMPFLYKFKIFRNKAHKSFDEKRGRSEGYKLSKAGDFIQKSLINTFPDQFCNLYVAIAEKV